MKKQIMSINTHFIKRKMKQENLSVYQLAIRMNVNPTTIYKILNGQRGMTTKTTGKLLHALQMDGSHLKDLFIFNKVWTKRNRKK